MWGGNIKVREGKGASDRIVETWCWKAQKQLTDLENNEKQPKFTSEKSQRVCSQLYDNTKDESTGQSSRNAKRKEEGEK